jgi:alkylated DNA nucleotide flippase Atl1
MASVDFGRAAAFIAAGPNGRWTTYGDVAKAGGVPAQDGGQAIGEWLRREGHTVRNVYRVLTVQGYVADGFRPAGPGVPADRERVRDVLRKEGVTIGARGRASKLQRFRVEDWASAQPPR